MVKKKNIFESLNLNLFNNKSAKKSYNGILIIAGILGVMFLMNFAAGSWRMGGAVAGGQSGNLTTQTVMLYANNSWGTPYNLTANSQNGTPYAIGGETLAVNLTIKEGIQETIVINVSNHGNVPNDAQNGTINQINITFDQSFTITLLDRNNSLPIANENASISPGGGVGSNGSIGDNNNTITSNFSITTSNGKRFSWLNQSRDGILGNGSIASPPNNATFRFNITGAVPGTYNITVLMANSTIIGQTNLSSNLSFVVKINDTTAPNFVNLYANSTGASSITPIYSVAAIPATTSKVNLSSKTQAVTLYASINVTDFNETGAGGIGYAGQGIERVSFYFYNDTGLANYTNVTGSNIRENFGFNLTSHRGSGDGVNLTDGNYLIVVRNFKDIGNNTNATAIAYNVTIDGTNPSVTVAKDATSTAHQLVLTLTVSDATSGINGKQCSVSGGGVDGITMSGTTGTQTSTQAGLGCNTAYTYTVACTDHAGNTNSQSVTTNTDGCTGGGGTSGTSSGTSGSDVVGSATSAFWILTYNEASTDLSDDSDGVSVNLAERYRAKVKVDTKLYYVGVVDTTDTTAKINVTTSAQDKEATLSVGDVKKFDVNADDKYDLSVTLNGVDSATGKADLSVIYIQEPVSAEEQAGVEEQAGTEATPTTGKSKTWIWVVVVLAVLVVLGAIFFGKKNARHKNYGF